MLAIARVSGLFLFLPMFAGQSVPIPARVALASGISLLAMSGIDVAPPMPDSVFVLGIYLLKEVIVGLLMGFAVKMVFYLVEFAAYIITVEIGLMPSPEFDPMQSRGGNPLGSLVYFLALVIFLNGTEYHVFYAFLKSYEISPIGMEEVNLLAVEEVITATAGIFKIGILIAAPLVAVNFLINLIFAVIGKVTPKLNVFILSFPVRILAGTSVFAFTSVLIAYYIINYLGETPEMMMRFIFFRAA
ncbi:MAG: flagellar biosynthetic protein FliR [Verrucomicrobiota bacterium]